MNSLEIDKNKIKTILLTHRICAQNNDFVALDKRLVVTNGGDLCDMYKGPCACGAWHNVGDIEYKFAWMYKNDK